MARDFDSARKVAQSSGMEREARREVWRDRRDWVRDWGSEVGDQRSGSHRLIFPHNA